MWKKVQNAITAVAVAAVGAVLAVAFMPVAGQAPVYRAPRTASGKPDLNGVWQALNAAGSVPPGLGVVEGDEIPYQPDVLAKKKENQENWLTADPEIKCYLPGVPRATYMPYPFQILQNAKAIFIAYEYAGAVRNIYLNDPGPAPVDAWMGQSAAHWEGETLVVD